MLGTDALLRPEARGVPSEAPERLQEERLRVLAGDSPRRRALFPGFVPKKHLQSLHGLVRADEDAADPTASPWRRVLRLTRADEDAGEGCSRRTSFVTMLLALDCGP